jgi:hypothetical protein
VLPKKLVLGILVFVVINLLQALLTPISEDEAYYWVWSQNLDWGYFDHPPMIAWWISVGYSLFQSELGVRLLMVLFNGLSFYFLWKILQPKTQLQENLFWAISGSVTVFQVFGFLATPDAPLLFFTIFYLFSLQNFLKKSGSLETILLAISFAGIMYSKYHGILLILFTLIPILSHLWKNVKFYLAILGSLLLYLPHILWLVQHDFSPISYHFLERSADEDFEIIKLINYLLFILLGCAPFLVYFVHQSLWKLKTEDSFQKSVKWLTIGPIIFFFFSIFKDNVQPQWLLISYIAMAILTYWNQAEKKNNKWIFSLGFSGIFVFLVVRVLLILPSISPFQKYENFGKKAGELTGNKVIFEKYQEASLFKFYHPDREVAVHRTLGNRKSQYTLWDWEEDFHGQTVDYVSPWVKSDKSFVGLKNRNYFVKEISNYQTYHLVEIETVDELNSKPNETLSLKIKIRNGHQHPIEIGENSEMKLTANYYQSKQYEIDYSTKIETAKTILQPNEELELKIQFPNISEKGEFNLAIGMQYAPIGTTYLSKPILVKVQ